MFPFNLQTEKGSALHEAALFGKTDVVQILLAAGERMFPLWSTNVVIPSPRAWGNPFLVQQVSPCSCRSSSEQDIGEVGSWNLALDLSQECLLAPPSDDHKCDLMKHMNVYIVRQYSCFCPLYPCGHRYWCEHKGQQRPDCSGHCEGASFPEKPAHSSSHWRWVMQLSSGGRGESLGCWLCQGRYRMCFCRPGKCWKQSSFTLCWKNWCWNTGVSFSRPNVWRRTWGDLRGLALCWGSVAWLLQFKWA